MTRKLITSNTEFTQLCLRTESNNFPAIRERLANKEFQSFLVTLLVDIHASLSKLDTVKKYIFYGKDPIGMKEFSEEFCTLSKCYPQSIPAEQFDEKSIRFLHGVIGKNTEGGELLQPLIGFLMHNLPIDAVNAMEEVGDGGWYDSLIADSQGFTIDQAHTSVIQKLEARFPDKFTEEHAINRDLTNEREVLEEGFYRG